MKKPETWEEIKAWERKENLWFIFHIISLLGVWVLMIYTWVLIIKDMLE